MAKEFYSKEFVEKHTHDIPERVSFTDLTGQKFGKIEVISWAGINKYNGWKKARNVWWCKCNCGETEYFLVDKASLTKGLSTSCGCNYKKNGNNPHVNIDEAEKILPHDYKLLEYTGRRKPCKAECRVCGDKESFDTFYSLQQRGVWCSCKDKDEIPKKLAERVDYTFTRRVDGHKMEAACNKCGCIRVSPVNTTSWLDECPCTYGADVDLESKPSCVYFNIDEYNPEYFKIGKADEPYSRLNQVMTSVRKEGYEDKHKFKIKHVKWFANYKVALEVESLYHRWFKDKALYGFKGTKDSVNVFDGSNELFRVSKEDIEEFNESYKQVVDYLEIDKPEYAILKDFSNDSNIQKPKGKLEVDVWFPRIGKLYEYIKIKRYPWKDEIINNSANLIEAYLKIKKEERNRMFEVDGEYYESSRDFYEQWSHLRVISFKTFSDRVRNKKREVWDALTSPREVKAQNKFYDLDGTEMKLTHIYNKYKPFLSYVRFKDKLLKGENLKYLINYVPRDSLTKVYLHKGKYYSNQMLYNHLNCVLRRDTFYSRLESGWEPLIASLVPTDNTYRYSHIVSNLQNIYPEIYSKLKGVV